MTEKEVFEFLSANADGLIFDYMGSEGGAPLEAVHISAGLDAFTQDAFIQIMGLDPSTPQGMVSRFADPEEFYEVFADTHSHMGDGLSEKAQSIVDVMRNHLRDVAVIVVGKEGYDVEPERPAYVLGLGSEHNLVGFKTEVVWT